MDKVINFIISNWEPIIAIIGLILSIFNLVYLLKSNLKSLYIKEIFYAKVKLKDRYYYEYNLILVNKSRQPISILDINFEYNKIKYSSKLDKMLISQYTDSKDNLKKFYSSEFPINLNSLESSKEMILFVSKENQIPENLKFTITTNRGKIKKKVSFVDKYITIDDYLEKIIKSN